MKPGRSQHPYGLLAPAARAALRFAARRSTPGRYGAWRSIALLWRRQRKRTDGVRAGRLAPAAGAVWLPSFHLHFMTRVNDRPWRGSMPGSLPVAAIYQRRVVMDYERTIVQSSMVALQPRRDPRPAYVVSHRQALSGSGVNVQAAAPYASSARRPVVPPAATRLPEHGQRPAYVVSRLGARSGSDTSIRAAAPYANSARQPVVPPTTTWITDHVQRLVRVFSHPSARGDSGTSVQAAALRANPARRLVVPTTTTLGTDRVQRLVRVFSRPNARGDSDANAQDMALHADPARRPIVPPITAWGTVRAQRPVRVFSLGQARSDSGTSVQVAAPYARSARRRIVPPTATWAADRAHDPNLSQTHPRIHLGSGAHAQARTLQTLRTSKREPLVLRPRSTAKGNAAPPHLQESTAAQPYFHPQELAWRRAVPPAAGIAGNERQADSRELGHQAHGRSFPEQGAGPGMHHAFGHAPAAALKIDSALMDRLADDVIRRVERRERIERARRGL
jgi:hypothetical protein